MWLFVIFVIVPIVEIALFIQMGGIIGLWPTLALVVLTAIVGSTLLRHQGRQQISDIQSGLSGNGNPLEPLAHGAFLLVSGVLLITPGFFTDAVGFLLLVPAFRNWAMKFLSSRMNIVQHSEFTTSGATPGTTSSGRTVDLDSSDYRHVEPIFEADTPDPNSPWAEDSPKSGNSKD